VLKISEVIIHPSYSFPLNPNDIALLKLTDSVDLTTYTPACLPAQGTDYTGQKGLVYGQHPPFPPPPQAGESQRRVEIWRRNFRSLRFAIVDCQETSSLSPAQTPIVSDSVCSTAMSLAAGSGAITSDMLCAGGMEGKDSCQVGSSSTRWRVTPACRETAVAPSPWT
jgi:hypothetical protein